MPAPRVFISSTYYDLQHVRNDLRTFIQGLGYELVMHDKGNIPYTQEVSLEEACYNELNTCDIVVCIIGGKFGTKSSTGDYSITMNELRMALKNRKKLYIYLQKDVDSENFTYLKNRSSDFKPYHADDIRIHEFIAELKETIRDNPITPFDNVSDITDHLRQQFAGLFQHLLVQEATITESKTYSDLQETAQSIRNLIDNFAAEKESFFNKFNSTIYTTSPVIRRILGLLGGKQYDLFASNMDAVIQYLSDTGFSIYERDDDEPPFLSCIQGTKESDGYKYILQLDRSLFDKEGNLCDIRDREKLNEYITLTTQPLPKEEDDLPF